MKSLLLKFNFFLLFLFFSLFGEKIIPPALQIGDTIAIIAPGSCPKEDRKIVDRAVNLIKEKGYKVKMADNLFTQNGYLAGTDRARAKAFMDLWLDPEVKALWCYRGGFGCSRILDRLDYEQMKKNPKILIGMSDVTALHLAINKKCDLVTFLGPNVNNVFGEDLKNDNEFNEINLWKIIASKQDLIGTGIVMKPRNLSNIDQVVMTIRPGVATGKLIGGNLSLICSLIGTPWEADFAGAILVLEEVGEDPYRIDRMLRQLQQTGILDNLNGLILCSWKGCQGKGKTLTLGYLFQEYFAMRPYPVLLGFPSGHMTDQVTLPINAQVELDAGKKTLKLLSNPVR